MAVVEDKISFVLYGSYEEQLDMLTNEQAGKWIKAVYSYVRTGEKQSDDPMVAMLLSVTSHQLDIDARKYAERLERQKEAASKAGKISAQKRAQKRAEAENEESQRLSTDVNDRQRFQHEDVDVDDDVDVYVDEDVDADVLGNNQYGDDDEVEDNARARGVIHNSEVIHNNGEVIRAFEEGYRTTQAEVEKCKAFANELFLRYANRRPTEFDHNKVFAHCHKVVDYDEEITICVFDPKKAELLRYAVYTAANADQLNWRYIEGIYTNFRHRDITCMDDVDRDNAEYYYGPLMKHLGML